MKREGYAFISFALAIWGLLLFSTSSAQETDSLRTSIIEGVQSNLDAVKSMEARVNEQSENRMLVDKKVQLVERKVEKVIWFSAPKWRQQVKTTVPTRGGGLAPYTSDSLFDGGKTVQHINSQVFITKGNAMVFRPSQDLEMGYRFSSWFIPQSLRYATTIELDDQSDGGSQRHLLRVTLLSPGRVKRTSTLWLDREAGFLIVRANSVDAEGRMVSERRNTTLAKQGGVWFLMHGEDESWRYVDANQRETTAHQIWDVSLQSVNQPIQESAFILTYPADAVVVDQTTPKKTNLKDLPSVAIIAQHKKSRSQTIALAGVGVAALILLGVTGIAIGRRKRAR